MLGARATPVAGRRADSGAGSGAGVGSGQRGGRSGPVPVYRGVCKPLVLFLRSQSEAVGMCAEDGAATREKEIRFWLLHIWWSVAALLEAARRIQGGIRIVVGDGDVCCLVMVILVRGWTAQCESRRAMEGAAGYEGGRGPARPVRASLSAVHGQPHPGRAGRAGHTL